MTTKQLVGMRIFEARTFRELTQQELSDTVGVLRNTLSQYEHGLYTPSAESLLKIADALDVSMDYLFGRTMIDKLGRRWEITTVRENNDKPRSCDDDFAESNRCHAKLPRDPGYAAPGTASDAAPGSRSS